MGRPEFQQLPTVTHDTQHIPALQKPEVRALGFVHCLDDINALHDRQAGRGRPEHRRCKCALYTWKRLLLERAGRSRALEGWALL